MSETCNQPRRDGRSCWRQTGHPSGHCYQHRGGGSHRAALAAARDEVVRAAVALDAAFTDHEAPDVWSLMAARKLAWADHRAAVAALAKLEGK